MDLQQFPVIDHHAQALTRPEVVARSGLIRAFTEADDQTAMARARETLGYRRSIREIAALLGCEASEAGITARRDAVMLEDLTKKYGEVARIQMMLLDDGQPNDQTLPIKWHANLVPAKRILRLEALAEGLMRACERFDEFEDRLRYSLEHAPEEVVAYKTIACYRSGLDVQVPPRDEARDNYIMLRRRNGNNPVRLTNKVLIDYTLSVAFTIAVRKEMPVQVHTGVGQTDLDLRGANPLHLRRVLEDAAWRRVTLVLLHSGYPYMREAGYLAAMYPQVSLDLSMAAPLLSVGGMHGVLGQLLEMTSWSKIMYSSGGHYIPEMYYLGAKWGREILTEALEGAVHDSDLTANEADQAARSILSENARRLYRLG